MSHEQAQVLLAIDAEQSKQPAATKTKIKERTGYGTPKVNETLAALVEDGVIEEHKFQKESGQSAKTSVEGFRRVKSER